MIAAYRGLLRVQVGVALAYRTRLTLWILSSLFPLLMMAVWLAVVDQVGPTSGWERTDFIAYYVAAALLHHVTTSFITWTWDEDLRTGNLSFKLTKPLDPFHHYLTQELGFRLVILAFLLPAVVGLTLVLPDLSYRLGFTTVVLTAAAVVSGLLLNVLMSMAFATVGFWSTQVASLYSLWWGAGAFLSGWIAPLDLLPEVVRRAGILLPFRASMGFPLDLMLGRLEASETTFGFAVTAFWLATFAGLYRVLWRRGLRRYQAVGG